MQMEKLIHVYLAYRKGNNSPGEPKVDQPLHDPTLAPLFKIEVMDPFGSYFIFFWPCTYIYKWHEHP